MLKISLRISAFILAMFLVFFTWQIPAVAAMPNITLFGDDGDGNWVGVPLPENDFKIKGYENIEFGTDGERFYRTIYDGTYIYTVGDKSCIVRLDPVTGVTSNYYYNNAANTTMGNTNTLTHDKFIGGTFSGVMGDGNKYIWLTPKESDSIVRVDLSDGSMKGFPLSIGSDSGNVLGSIGYKFFGSAVETNMELSVKNIWFSPGNADRVAKFDTINSQLTYYPITGTNVGNSAGNIGLKFVDATYDWVTKSVWMVPFESNRLVQVNVADGSMKFYDLSDGGAHNNTNMGNSASSGKRFQGGVFDGTSMWLIPNCSNRMVQVDVQTGTMTGYEPIGTNMPASNATYKYSGGAFDGENIWISPDGSQKIVKFNVASKTFIGIDIVGENVGNYKTSNGGHGTIFDGTNIWMAPHLSNRLIRLSPNEYPYSIEYYYGSIQASNKIGTNLEGEDYFHFLNHKLDSNDIASDTKDTNWINSRQLIGYASGQVDSYPTIINTSNPKDNLVQVLYPKLAVSPILGGAVTAKYQDINGNPIAADVIFKGNVGQQYITTLKQIPGYTFQSLQGIMSGYFTSQPQTVVYLYGDAIKVNPKTGQNNANLIHSIIIIIVAGSVILLTKRRILNS